MSEDRLTQEFEIIKKRLLHAFLKIRITKSEDIVKVDLLETNAKAQKRLHIRDEETYDLILGAKEHLSSQYDWYKAFDAVAESKKEFCIEVENTKNNKFFHILIIPTGDACALMTIQDISALKKSKNDLVQTEEIYRSFSDQIPEIICEVDHSGMITFANKAGLEKFGYRLEDVEKGLDIKQFFQSKDIPKVITNFRKILRGENVPSSEYTVNSKYGKIHIMLSTSAIIRQNKVVGLRAVMADITKKDELEKVLLANQQNFQNLFDSMQSFVIITDVDGTILHVNKTLNNRLNYTNTEIINQNISIIHPEVEFKRFPKLKNITDKQPVLSTNIPYVTKEKEAIHVLTTITTGKWDMQKVYFIVSQDMSDLAESEEKFSRAFHSNPALMAITTTDGYVIDVNKALLDTIGYKKEEIVHKSVVEIDLISSVDILNKIRQEAQRNSSVKNLELVIQTKAGEKLNCLFSADYIRNKQSSFVLVVITDLSKIHQLNQRLDMAMKTARLAWYDFNLETGIVRSGSNKAQMLGYNHNKFQNKHYSVWTELIHPKDYELTMQNIKDVFAQRTDTFQIDYRIKRADGTFAWFYDRGVVTEKDSKGKPLKMIGVVIDISDRKKTERKLHQTLKEYQHATDNVSSIIWKTEIDINKKFTNSFISKVGDKILGLKEDGLDNDLYKFISFIHTDDMEMINDVINNEFVAGNKTELEYRIVKENGEIIWVLTQASIELDEDGKTMIYGVTMDTSQRKKAELEIREQRKFLHKLIDTLPSMVAVKNAKGEYINVNNHFADFYDLKPKDILGKVDEDFLEKDFAKDLNSNDEPILKGGIPVYYEAIHTIKGEKKYYEVAKVPIKDTVEKYDKLLIVSNDITEQILTKQEIQLKSQQLLLLTENIEIQIWYLQDIETYGIANKAHSEFIGFPKSEIENKSIYELFPKNLADNYIESNKQCFTTKKTIHFDEWNKNNNDEHRLLRITKTPMLKSNGDVNFVICIARDVTEEYTSELELKKAMQFNQLLIDTSPIGIVVFKPNGECILVNDSAIEIVGAKSQSDLLNRNFLISESWKVNSIDELFMKAYMNDIQVHSAKRVTTEFNKTLWLDCIFQKIEYMDEVHIMMIIDDITDVKSQELSIKNNLERQRTLSQVAFELSETKDFEESLNNSLRIIGEFLGVSRVYVFRNSPKNSHYSNEYEWCNIGIEPQINELQNIPFSKSPEIKQILESNEPIYCDDIENLPSSITNILKPQGIRSLLVYPIFLFNEFAGFVGVDENIIFRKWLDDDFEFMQTISHIISSSYERKIISDNLSESEEMFKKITGGAMDGIILINKKGLVQYWNPAAEQIFGYKRFEILDKSLHELLAGQDSLQQYLSNKKTFANTGTGNAIGRNLELVAFHKRGHAIDIELSLSSLQIKGEWHALGIVRDITERKEAENQLRTLSKAVEFASVTIVITAPDGTIEYVNKKFQETTGYSEEETIGKNPKILSSGKHPKAFYKNLWQTIQAGKEWKGEFLNQKKNGETYYESAMISSVSDDNGNIMHYIGIKEDITKQKLAQREILKAKRNAEMANKAKSDFLANMSHEIRTPMNAVIGFSEILAQKVENAEHKSYLESIQASSKTLLNLINDILDLSKIEAGKMQIKPDPVELGSIIQDVSQIFSLKIQQKELTIEIDIDPNIPEFIFIDELRLRQILLNLIGNAVKFTEDGYVKIIAENEKVYENGDIRLSLKVEDSGIGIDPNSQIDIFEAFQQHENHNTRKYGGTGLGLSITKRLVEMQGGSITLKSKLGEGSSFCIVFDHLKIPKIKKVQQEKSENKNLEYTFSGETILVVDDVPSNRFLIKSFLAEHNLNIIEAENGEEGVEMCHANKPAIVLMDLRMPVMNGIEATKQLKSNEKTNQIPVVAVTASSMHFDHNDIKNAGFDAFLEKPVSKEEIIDSLVSFLKPQKTAIQGTSEPDIISADNSLKEIDKELISILNQTLCPIIKRMKDSGNIDETIILADNLLSLGKAHGNNELITIAEKLKIAGKSFDIEAIQEIIHSFERICQSE